MSQPTSPASLITPACPPMTEGFGEPARGDVRWATLFSADQTPTSAMSAGIMTLRPNGGQLMPHRHLQPELYYIAAGSGLLYLDGTEHPVTIGQSSFIHGNVEHGLRNDGTDTLRVFYVFPTDCFGDVQYRFTGDIGSSVEEQLG